MFLLYTMSLNHNGTAARFQVSSHVCRTVYYQETGKHAAGTITFSSYLAKMSAEYIPKCMKSIRGKLKQQKMVAGFVVSPTIYLFLAKSRHDPDFFFFNSLMQHSHVQQKIFTLFTSIGGFRNTSWKPRYIKSKSMIPMDSEITVHVFWINYPLS